jgi:hypothetical protein
MPAKYDDLQKALDDLTLEVAETEGVTESAVALIDGFAIQVTAAVEAALTADNAADQGSIDTSKAAIEAVRQRFAAAKDKLGAAVEAVPKG